MRSSGRNTGSNRDDRGAGRKRDDRQKREGRPRPEERRYDQGGKPGGQGGSGKAAPGGRGAAKAGPKAGGAKGSRPAAPSGAKPGQRSGAKPGAKPGAKAPKTGARSQSGTNVTRNVTKSGAPKARTRRASAPARPREYEAKVEERNRARHSGPKIQLPKTFGEVDGERLQKVLARAGMGSRRACEDLIEQARVEVNGEIVLEQGVRVDPAKDEIKVDGLTIATQSYLFFALNKPAGVVASMEDPDGRQCLGDYVQNRETRLFHVGRLDTETEGLILLTNHGELAHRLTHPRYGVKKTYLAAIQGPLPRDLGKRLKDGIRLDDGYARADHFRVVENTGKNYLVEVSLHEGRKHIVRRMLAEAGFPVEKLVRTRFGPIALGDQKSGWLRRMTNTEVGMLMGEVGL
ncbi:pseudouridine synthase [Streptomyces sp. HNM0574]|uniref:pseudouridine synthase n=1 Tax=Streptomyces sp. HNM0574 TaxID=2714954 RepID=UPI00146AC5F4|nr:pseudouridine synthase [Streptomyces sp. HNM0574]NLU69070.1 pseudouridine synthase [Streptomyces sp. HNM0574]